MSQTPDILTLALEEYKIPVRPGFITGGTFCIAGLLPS